MRRLWSVVVTAGLVGAGVVAVAAPAPAASPSACTSRWTAYSRPATHTVVSHKDVHIPMSDGVNLVADVNMPNASPGTRFPVIVSQTPYTKTAVGNEPFFVQRGYVQVVVEVRGTGTSEGQWHGFDAREQRDGYEILQWVMRQPWSDGRIGLYGPSYLAINQFFTAAQHPRGLKAIFPIVPMSDPYRDIIFEGGQTNVAFIPAWLGLVTGLSLAPGSNTAGDPAMGVPAIAAHAQSAADYQAGTLANAVSGGDITYDSAYWRSRAPIEAANKVDVPTFITGGLHDLFQRGEPMLYERLRSRGVTTKLLMGPWGHLDGSAGKGLPSNGVPALTDIALRWFDQYVRGKRVGAECLPNVTQFLIGHGSYQVQPDWPAPNMTPRMEFLHPEKALAPLLPGVNGGTDLLPQNTANGACSRSTNQWLMGAIDATPCNTDNRLTEAGELTYSTSPVSRDTRLTGPVAARIWATTTAREAVLAARLTDVAPDGTSTELSTGLISASHRAVDRRRSRIVDGVNLQPWHPFTRRALLPVTAGKAMPLDVEIFPINALIKAGHRIRLSIGSSDFPHAAAPLPGTMSELGGVLTIHHDATHPSSVALPVVP
jgi:putative CocE/NonD family hydrolase